MTGIHRRVNRVFQYILLNEWQRERERTSKQVKNDFDHPIIIVVCQFSLSQSVCLYSLISHKSCISHISLIYIDDYNLYRSYVSSRHECGKMNEWKIGQILLYFILSFMFESNRQFRKRKWMNYVWESFIINTSQNQIKILGYLGIVRCVVLDKLYKNSKRIFSA